MLHHSPWQVVQQGRNDALKLKHGSFFFFFYDLGYIVGPNQGTFGAKSSSTRKNNGFELEFGFEIEVPFFFFDLCYIAPTHRITFNVESSSRGGLMDPSLSLGPSFYFVAIHATMFSPHQATFNANSSLAGGSNGPKLMLESLFFCVTHATLLPPTNYSQH